MTRATIGLDYVRYLGRCQVQPRKRIRRVRVDLVDEGRIEEHPDEHALERPMAHVATTAGCGAAGNDALSRSNVGMQRARSLYSHS